MPDSENRLSAAASTSDEGDTGQRGGGSVSEKEENDAPCNPIAHANGKISFRRFASRSTTCQGGRGGG